MNPVFIIGAARSGTNMLRDILVQLPNYGTWDCDEINPIWRHGNIGFEHDIFPESLARPEVYTFIRKEFEKIAKKLNVHNVIEKSCANSLRLPFINKIFPEAKYIFIYRDGRDTVVSAKSRWNAAFNLKYSLKKLRYVPTSDLLYYSYTFGLSRLKQLFSKEKTLSFWGVRLPDMQNLIRTNSLEEICAIQWNICIQESLSFFEHLSKEKYISLSYEDFVNLPNREMNKILLFLGLDNFSENTIQDLVKNVKKSSVGNYKAEIKDAELMKIENIMHSSLVKLKYLDK